MKEQLDQLKATATKEITTVADLDDLEALRVKFLGRKGAVTDVLRSLSDAPPEERPALGQAANDVKQAIAEALDVRKETLATKKLERQTTEDAVDLTLPGKRTRPGHMHPLSRVTDELISIFAELGYQVATGPDIETEYYNFDSLNTPADHPARDAHDTFFLKPGTVLRTHTSPVQMRIMEKTQPPVAIVVPGRVYRVDYDASHSPMFNQLEGLYVDKNVTFADLKGTIMLFIRRIFGENTKIRFRPHFFPFTEPSAEVDISCTICKGKGCRVCKNSGWLEILGCGMVHPQVFKYANYDYEKYSGFAFGLGLDRITMLRHTIPSIGHLYENDLRFLEQF